ncbi:hypothetical protein F5Y08DRAFT_299306 [Xylaria arbuscula]|nr:hypothetical protein F5Y08DRAFT_299306 [Xylaria arbuscula]
MMAPCIACNHVGMGAHKGALQSAQRHEYHFAINALRGYLLTRLLNPSLNKIACCLPPKCVSPAFAASLLVDMMNAL